MSRLNWIIQLNTDDEKPGFMDCLGGNWRDCHDVSSSKSILHPHAERGIVRDSFGNKGFQSKKAARDELERLRNKFPRSEYRLIKIAE